MPALPLSNDLVNISTGQSLSYRALTESLVPEVLEKIRGLQDFEVAQRNVPVSWYGISRSQ